MALRRKHEVPKEKVLEVDASMQGTLTFKDPVNLRINGKFEGKLLTKGSLTVGEHAVVNADITGDVITVAGRVNGDIKASVELNLIAPAFVVGDIKAPALRIAQGAIIEGYCNMISDRKGGEPASDMLTIDQVAKFLEVDTNVITEWADTGKLPAVKDGSRWSFERSKIEEWLTSEKIK
ncbi:MAG: polymer-forming cytoskeletal protein [Candidatus Omnitrophica bacterium]|nr:polymer-forming cytoskeletal protein [Candidatus Omnitrophota bacterium]